MDEKTLRVLTESCSVEQMRVIGDGALFHVDVVIVKKVPVTALTGEGAVKTCAVLDAAAESVVHV